MVDAVYSEIPLPELAEQDWRSALRSLAHRTREVARQHEWFGDLLGSRPHLGPHALAYLEASLAALDMASAFDGIDDVMQAVQAVNAYLLGAIRREITELRAERTTGMDEQEWQLSTGPYLSRALATGQYPTLARVVHEATHPDADSTVDTGLDYVLDGIAARLPHS